MKTGLETTATAITRLTVVPDQYSAAPDESGRAIREALIWEQNRPV
jgi:hypothetical protein